MRKCRFCHKDIEDAATVCQHCGRDLIPGRTAASVETETEQPSVPIRVSVVDVNMPFSSMVGFMVKWAVAAVPAFLILAAIGFLLGVVFGALFR